MVTKVDTVRPVRRAESTQPPQPAIDAASAHAARPEAQASAATQNELRATGSSRIARVTRVGQTDKSSLAAARAALNALQAPLTICANKAVEALTAMEQRLTARIDVAADGVPVHVRMGGRLATNPVGYCVEHVLRAARFGAQPQAASAQYDLVLAIKLGPRLAWPRVR